MVYCHQNLKIEYDSDYYNYMRYYPACRPYGKVAEARLVSFQDCMLDASVVRAVLRSVLYSYGAWKASFKH